MKKIITIIISFLIFNLNVFAETYYGDYYFIGHEENEISDEIKKEEIKLYNTYRIEKKDMGYMLENNNYIKDERDFKYEELYTKEYNDETEEKVTLNYGNIEIDTIRIENLHLNLKITEIEVYHKENKLKYTIDFKNVGSSYLLFNNEYEKSATFSNQDTYLNIILDKKYNINDLQIIIYTKNSKFETKLIIDEKEFILNFNNGKIHNIYFDKKINNFLYLYKNKKIMYRYYKEEKVVENIYVKEGENLIYEDYKFINRYYKRDKLVISDDNVIDDDSKNVYSFIEYASNDVRVECDINYEINGEYNCLYILNGISVNKKIIVNKEKQEVIENQKINVKKVSNKVKKENNVLDNSNINDERIEKDTLKQNKTKNEYKNKLVKITVLLIYLFIIIFSLFKKKKK